MKSNSKELPNIQWIECFVGSARKIQGQFTI